MAKFTVSGFEMQERTLARMERGTVRRIVEAGAKAAAKRMAEQTERAGHGPPGHSRRATGDMLESIGENEYREWLGGGAVDVYPQGTDRKGVRNATKAYVINYGRGGTRKSGGMGDKFITGDEAATEEAVVEAMQAESDRILAEAQQ